MKLVLDVEKAKKLGILVPLGDDAAPAKKRGRPSKADLAAREAAEEDEETEDEEDEDETPAPKKKPAKKAATKKSKKAVEEDEDESDDEESDDEDESDDEEAEDEEEYATGDDLKKIKAALTAHKKANGGKPAATVKVLKKFGPSSEKIPVGKVKALLKALKV